MKILHILGSLDIGGVELRTLELQRALVEDDIIFDYACLSGRAGELAPAARAMGSKVFPVTLGGGGVWRLYRLVRDGEYDGVHSHVATASGVILLVAMIARVPGRIAHFRSDGDSRKQSVRRNAQRWLGRRLIGLCANIVLGVSPGALAFAKLTRSEESRMFVVGVVPNGVPTTPVKDSGLRAELGLTPKDCVVVHVGKPTQIKRRGLAASIVLSIPRAHVVFVGPNGNDLRSATARLAAGDMERVHILGARQDVRGLVAECDALLLPSLVEGLPGVVLEALSVGTPAVTTELSGSIMIAESVQGVALVPADASIEGWARAVVESASSESVSRAKIAGSFGSSQFTDLAASQRLRNVYGAIPTSPDRGGAI